MMKKMLLYGGLVGFCWAAPKVDFPPQIEVRVANAPMAAPLMGGNRLLYELVLCNHEMEPYELKKLTFLDQHGATLQEWDEKQLGQTSAHFGSVQDHSLVLAPGASMVVFCSLPADDQTNKVRHRLDLASQGRLKTLTDEGLTVQSGLLPLFGSPFGKPGAWNAASAPSNKSVHRRTMLALQGHFYSAQRFAIDWVLTDDKHRFFGGQGKRLEDHYCYGVPVLAVADGTVVDLQDGQAEGQPSQTERAVEITPRTVGGNWVALEVAPHRYAMYAHLQPNSLRVKKGERVKQGEVLGLIGNSGNSTAPHLHLHVSDRPDWVDAEGVPYAFDYFRCLGQCSSPDDGEHVQFTPYPRGEVHGKLPFEDALVEFGGSPAEGI